MPYPSLQAPLCCFRLHQTKLIGEECEVWIERRTVSSLEVPYLVFETALGTSLARVHIRKRWNVPSSGSSPVTVPLHHQMAVVDLACAL